MKQHSPPSHATVKRRFLVFFAVFGLLASLFSPLIPVQADDISNSVDASIDVTAESMGLLIGGANGSTQLFVTPRNNDGKNGCNLTGSSTLVLAVTSSNPAIATVSPGSVTFASCGETHPLSVAPLAQGVTTISVTTTSNNTGGTFNLAPATFNVNVAAPVNTAPVVAVFGVTHGASYEIGSAPTATCSVKDLEDSDEFAVPILTGTLTNGIGSQTATCAYEDHGGLSASASATYSIIDSGSPALTCIVPPQDVWYSGNQSVSCTANDAGSGLANPADASFSLSTDVSQNSHDAAASSGSKQVCDNAGNCLTAGPYTYMIDRAAPTISSTRTFTSDGSSYPGNWTRNKVTVTFFCNDNGGSGGSDIIALESETPVNTNGEAFNGTITSAGTCVDPVGNEGPHGTSDLVQVDKKDPVVSPADIADTAWRNTALSHEFESFDADSGLADPADASFTLEVSGDSTRDGDGNPVPTAASRTVEDTVGNKTTRILSALIDTAPPVISAHATTADGNDYMTGVWTNQTVTVHFYCADALSGIQGDCPDDVVISENTEQGGQSVSASVDDLAGNSAASNEIVVRVDKTSPVISASATSADGTAYSGAWVRESVTVHFVCSDTLSGLATACPSSVTTGTDTPLNGQPISASVSDLAGNIASSETVVVKVDKSLPAIGDGVVTNADGSSYSPGAGRWTNQGVTVTWACLDSLSGPVTASVSDTMGEGAHQVANGTCADNAGNTASSSVSDVNVDLTAPTSISIPAFGPFYFGERPALPTTCSAIDALSGLNNCTIALDSASNGSIVGVHTLIATAVDNAGNVSTRSFRYEVLSWTPRGFYQPVDMGIVVNTVKAGSTVPLKFEVFAGPSELTDTTDVKSLTYVKVTMSNSTMTDEIELVATGGTILRYDAIAGQFVYNWSTKGLVAGQCYRVTVSLQDGSTIIAYFKMK